MESVRVGPNRSGPWAYFCPDRGYLKNIIMFFCPNAQIMGF